MLAKLKTWVKNTWGRLVTATGAIATGVGTALAALSDNSGVWLPHFITLTSARIAAGVMLCLLYIASFIRHQKAAKIIGAINDPKPNSQPPVQT